MKKKFKKKVDVGLLTQLLAEEGYKSSTPISFGYVIKWFSSRDEGKESFGMIRTNHSQEIGFRLSHRYNPQVGTTVSATLRDPQVDDYVFVLPISKQQQDSSRSPRPYAVVWGLVEDLPLTVLKSETLFDFLLRALSQWWWNRKTKTLIHK